MRSINPTAVSRLRTIFTSESSISHSRTQQKTSPCVLCAHRIPQHTVPRRYQSTLHSTPREDTNSRPQTHYTFFPSTLPAGPPPHGHFTIDLGSLKKEFLQLQSRAHPDLHPAENKNRAQAMSARINEAYKTLQSPLLRAQYLLSLRGIDVAEDEHAKIEDSELLMEVLETQEQIEEAETEMDLEGMKRHNDERIGESVGKLEDAFREDDVEGAKHEAVRLRYWINIKESLHQWERGNPVSFEH